MPETTAQYYRVPTSASSGGDWAVGSDGKAIYRTKAIAKGIKLLLRKKSDGDFVVVTVLIPK